MLTEMALGPERKNHDGVFKNGPFDKLTFWLANLLGQYYRDYISAYTYITRLTQ